MYTEPQNTQQQITADGSKWLMRKGSEQAPCEESKEKHESNNEKEMRKKNKEIENRKKKEEKYIRGGERRVE